MTAILNIFRPAYHAYFWADFGKPCIKINGLLSTLLQDILTAYIAFLLRNRYKTKIDIFYIVSITLTRSAGFPIMAAAMCPCVNHVSF